MPVRGVGCAPDRGGLGDPDLAALVRGKRALPGPVAPVLLRGEPEDLDGDDGGAFLRQGTEKGTAVSGLVNLR